MQIRTIRNDENARIGHVGDGIKKLETKEEKKAILGDISNINSTKTDENATKPKEIVDIDKLDKGKPYACSEYVKPIYENMRVTENKYVVTADYLSTQPEIDEEMRSVLVDWLVDVHYKFKLQPETLYLCINYLDRYLSKTKVKRENLQLAGVCALLLSAKYEEIYFPKIKNFVSLTDNAYTRNDILKNESIMAKALDFNFTSPTIYQFILRYLKLAQESLEYQCVSYYFAERCLMEYSLISVPPSKLAAASLLLASKYIYNEFRWPLILENQSNYTIDEVKPISIKLEHCFKNADYNLQAIWRKYTRSVLHKASYIVHEKLGDSKKYISIAKN